MRIDKITLTNFKGFENETLEFKSQFNVIIGNNATGKTSILDALAVAAGAFFLGVDGADQKNFKKEEIRLIWRHNQPRPQLPVQIKAKGVVNDLTLSWMREIQTESGRTSRKGAEDLREEVRMMHQEYRSGKDITFPLISYHGTGRLWAEHQERVDYQKPEEGLLMGYKDCLSSKSSSKAFLAWYKGFSQDAVNFKDELTEGLLEAFHEVITDMIPEWSSMQYNYSLDQLIGFYKDDGGEMQPKSFNNLSDGYRNMIGMVADIAYRCIKLNPHLGRKVIKKTPGILLIDELDLHLHPKWQRLIVERLKKAFPKLQIVVTTHSPFIVQSLQSHELINLDEKSAQEDPFRKSLEEVAEDEMMMSGMHRSSRYKKMEAVAQKYFEYTLRPTSEQDSSELANIKQELNQHMVEFSDDPAYSAMIKAELKSRG